VEGKFFVWTPGQIESVLGKQAAETFAAVYGVTPQGNFEHGQSILNRSATVSDWAKTWGRDPEDLERELAASRAKLLAVRDARVHPGLDDKVLVAWNGFMIDALAMAAGALDEPRYLTAAQAAADFILNHMRTSQGRLLHAWRRGTARLGAYLDDYAALAGALVSLYEADFRERWIDEAVALADSMLRLFADKAAGGFFYTASDHEALIARQQDFYDGSVPSGNSLAASVLLRLGKLTGRDDYLVAAERTMKAAAPVMRSSPGGVGHMLLALDMYLGPTSEIVIIGDPRKEPTAAVLAALRHRFVPNKVVACRSSGSVGQGSQTLGPLFAGKEPSGDEPGVYICEQFACQAPLVGQEAAIAAWDTLAAPGSESS
jgi:uncharacterized protein